MTKHLKNIPLKTFRKYLEYKRMKQIRTTVDMKFGVAKI